MITQELGDVTQVGEKKKKKKKETDLNIKLAKIAFGHFVVRY